MGKCRKKRSENGTKTNSCRKNQTCTSLGIPRVTLQDKNWDQGPNS